MDGIFEIPPWVEASMRGNAIEADIQRRNAASLLGALVEACGFIADGTEPCQKCGKKPRIAFNPPPRPLEERWVASCGCNYCYHDNLFDLTRFWNAGLRSAV